MCKRNMVELIRELNEFKKERNWGQFHSAKNLAASVCIEAAELLEIFQWRKEDDAISRLEIEKARVEEESADVFIYLVQLADLFGIDLIEAAFYKLESNKNKYPSGKWRNRAW